jgi:hypothetical protein
MPNLAVDYIAQMPIGRAPACPRLLTFECCVIGAANLLVAASLLIQSFDSLDKPPRRPDRQSAIQEPRQFRWHLDIVDHNWDKAALAFHHPVRSWR